MNTTNVTQSGQAVKFFRLTKWRGQEPVREPIDATEAERLITAAREYGPIWLQTRPLDGEVSVQVPLTWNDRYIDWLHEERGSCASWEGPTCSYGYFSTYVYPYAGRRNEAIRGRYRTIRHMPLEVGL